MNDGGGTRRSPYAVLNLPHRHGEQQPPITDDQIRNSYKRLSRLLHPDKRPPGKEREDAQEIFIELQHAYEILLDPVLRQAYDHYGHSAVAQVRQNRYAPESLYRHLIELHDDGRSSEALDLLTITLEDAKQKQHKKEWEYGADVEINMHAGDANGILGAEVSSSSVSLSAAVPLPPQTSASPFPSQSENGQLQGGQRKQKMQLSIGGQSNLEKGLGSTRGSLSATYKAVAQTSVSSDVTVGRKHLETSLSSSTQLSNETALSFKMTRQYELGSGKDGQLSFGFSSHRNLSLFHDRTVQAMFAMGVGQGLKMQYGILNLTTWGLTSSQNEEDGVVPRITAKLTLGTQYPVTLSVEQPSLYKSAHRSGKASVAWSPTQGYKLKGMLTRQMSRRCGVHKSEVASKLSVGVEHTGLSGLKWIFRYQHPDGLNISVPIFVSSFLSPVYWSKVVWVSTMSFLLDETMEELAGLPVDLADAKADAPNVHQALSTKIRSNQNERQWLSSSRAQRDAERQLSLIEHVAKGKRKLEEAVDGLVILKATYTSVSSGASYTTTTLDVTHQVQFWVASSRLSLPPSSKSSLPGFYDLLGHSKDEDTSENISSELSELAYTLICSMNTWLTRLGVGGEGHLMDNQGCTSKSGSVILTVRYKHKGRVYEVTVHDHEALELPSSEAVALGPSDSVA